MFRSMQAQAQTPNLVMQDCLKFFGLPELEVIRQDIDNTLLPSWLQRAPANIGNPGHGKLSADQWRTLCTVHLPFSLIPLWTQPGAALHKKKALHNFMNLICAVLIGTARSTTSERQAHYLSFMQAYLRGLKDKSLFSNVKLVPNHHIALHLPEFLKRFGPTHAYWGFPFERYIGMLRRINTNCKPGMRTFNQG